MNERGLFIVFEGPEGGGKTIQTALLREHLDKKGVTVVQTREPGGTPWGEAIRNILLHKDRDLEGQVDPVSELLAFYAARRELINKIVLPNLKAGVMIIADRFEGSSFAYQGFARKLGTNLIENLSSLIVQSTGCIPDLYIVLDVPSEIGLERKGLQSADEVQLFEQYSKLFHQRVRDGFKEFVKRGKQSGIKFGHRIEELDATREIDIIHQEIVYLVEEVGKEKKVLKSV